MKKICTVVVCIILSAAVISAATCTSNNPQESHDQLSGISSETIAENDSSTLIPSDYIDEEELEKLLETKELEVELEENQSIGGF